MAEAHKGSRQLGRPPLWVMSVLAAAAVLTFLVVNRPTQKPVVSARPAATSDSPARTAAHRSTAKQTKPTRRTAPATTAAPGAPTRTAATPATVTAAAPTTNPPPTTVAPAAPVTVPAASLPGTLPRTD